MAFFSVLLSGLVAVIASLVALFAYDVSWSHALVIYLVFATVPMAFIMAALYINVLIQNTFGTAGTMQEAPRTR
ncbi:hypothetical protein N4R57_01010 [Rhodobacteraceae bacterium D3-12]|nr:hypothetical protein N4R57_01010 [Rhodobacteraceae bacterium D3-12]